MQRWLFYGHKKSFEISCFNVLNVGDNAFFVSRNVYGNKAIVGENVASNAAVAILFWAMS
jgi:hypothetical protein